MEIKAGDDYLTLPEAVEEHTAQLIIYPHGNPEQNPQSHARVALRISFKEYQESRAPFPETKVEGIPVYFAITTIEQIPRLFFWPVPSHDMYARFRYCPAMKEI